jgi:hypothetical protein
MFVFLRLFKLITICLLLVTDELKISFKIFYSENKVQPIVYDKQVGETFAVNHTKVICFFGRAKMRVLSS